MNMQRNRILYFAGVVALVIAVFFLINFIAVGTR